MKDLIHKITRTFWKVENKIAFYPTLIALGGILFGLIMVVVEQYGVSGFLIETMPVLVIKDVETARIILSSLIAGLISVLVFSFSMVMIILNQASTNFSPRLLPGLISNKKHQSILGIHLAGIFYCLITLISIQPTDTGYQLPGFSVLIAIVFITIGSAKAKRISNDIKKFKTTAVWFTLGLIIILISIPWPFSPFDARPLLRIF